MIIFVFLQKNLKMIYENDFILIYPKTFLRFNLKIFVLIILQNQFNSLSFQPSFFLSQDKHKNPPNYLNNLPPMAV